MEQSVRLQVKNEIIKSLACSKGAYIDLVKMAHTYKADESESVFCRFAEEVVGIAKKIRSVSFAETENTIVTTRTGKWVSIPAKLFVGKTPSAGFSILQGWLRRYADCELQPSFIRTESYCGKRNAKHPLDISFLCHDDARCRSFVKRLREVRGSRDCVELKKTSWDDDSDRIRGGYEHESEYSGERGTTLEVTVKTPAGKVKAAFKIAPLR